MILSNSKSQSHGRKGVALIITLSFLALVTVFVVGFVVAMRTERQAAASMASDERSKLIVQACLDHSISLLQQNIPQPLPPGTPPSAQNWSVAPGQLVVTGTTTTIVSLTSGSASSSADPDLNQVSPSGGAPPILAAGTPMRVQWQQLLQYPSQPSSANNPAVGRYAFWIDDENSKINFSTAYGKPDDAASYNLDNPSTTTWTDAWGYNNSNDEHNSFTYGAQNFQIPSPKSSPAIYTPTNPYSLGHPASVNLDILSNLDRDALWATGLSRRFQSPHDIKQFVPSGNADAFYNSNKFWLTHFNADPEFNAFGKSRIFLAYNTAALNSTTGTLTRYGTSGFAYVNEDSSMTVRDATEPLTFHSSLMNYDTKEPSIANGSTGGSYLSTSVAPASNMNGVQVAGNTAASAVARLAQYLNSTTWPGGYSGSFVSKWSAREADQVAWNLYGMAALGTVPGTKGGADMHDGSWANTTFYSRQSKVTRFSRFLWDGPLSGARILPQTRTPYISKFGIQLYTTWVAKDGTSVAPGGGDWVPDPVNPATLKGIRNTQRYVVSLRVQPEVMLPKNYQGYSTIKGNNNAEGWALGATPDRIYVTHLEATFNDGSGSGDRTVRWCSETPTDDGSLYWDSTGGYGSTQSWYAANKSLENRPVMPGDYRTFLDLTTSTAKLCDFSTYDAGGSRTLNVVFDSGSTATPQPCTVKNMKLRFVCATGAANTIRDMVPYQISPIRDIDGAPGFESATPSDAGVIVFPQFTLPTDQGSLHLNSSNTNNTIWVMMETTDPRVNQRGSTPSGVAASVPPATDDWQPSTNYGTLLGNENLGHRATRLGSYPAIGTYGDESKCASFDSSSLAGPSLGFSGGNPSDTNRRLGSVGWLSCVSTGIQRGRPWSTLQFHKGAMANSPPDWLLMDLFAAPYNAVNYVYPQVAPTGNLPQPLTYMNSTAGKININALIFPQNGALFNLPQTGSSPARDAPIRALFKNMLRPNLASPPNPTQISESTLFNNIVTYLNAKPNKVFDYAGEICEVPGVADAASGANEWEREALVRSLASLITTRSNSFSVWGVAQTLTKSVVTGEKRFHAIVERYVWPGVDGVPGNGNTANGSSYATANFGSSNWLGSPTNVIDAIDPTQPRFEQSFNPGAAKIKYRVVYFEYLN